VSQLPPLQTGPAQNPYATPNFGGYGGGGPPPGPIKNYLVESIISLICCGGLFAIPAIVYAAKVNGLVAQGNYPAAMQASANAKKWLIIAICIGVVCNLIGGAIQIIAAMNANPQ
jgi:Interferon-induced transmembrane protein